MDNFLDFLVKKSDIDKNEYFNYRQPRKTACVQPKQSPYEKITEPVATDYVVFDLETTGMKAGVNGITEIGAVKVIDGEIAGVFNTLVDPEQFIPYYITNITHITNDMVAGKRTIREVLPEFLKFAEGLPLIAHNAPFDMSFIIANASRLGIEVNNPVLDTLYLSRKYNKECEKHNLAYLTSFFNIELKNAHRAYFDALATERVYRIIRQKYNETLKQNA